MARKYVVTGGAGFIGSNIVHGLNKEGIDDIIVVDNLKNPDKFLNIRDADYCDYLDKDEFRRHLLAGHFHGQIDTIFHQGACSDTTEADGRYMMDNNFTYSKDLLHFALKERVGMIYASSAAIYGGSPQFEEIPAHEAPLNVYGYSKLLFDQYVRRIWGDVTTTLVGLRYFNVYGPREAHKGKMASIAFQLLNQLKDTGHCKLFSGTDGYGDGEQVRDFISIDDAVAVNLFLLKHPGRKAIVNVGTGHARSFNAIAKILIKRIGGTLNYTPFPESLRGKYQSFTQADTRRLRSLGFNQAFTSLDDGLQRYLDFLDDSHKR